MQNIGIEQTREFIVSNFLYGESDKLAHTTSFMGEGIIDSTGILELIGFLEATYQIKIADHEIYASEMLAVLNPGGFVCAESRGYAVLEVVTVCRLIR